LCCEARATKFIALILLFLTCAVRRDCVLSTVANWLHRRELSCFSFWYLRAALSCRNGDRICRSSAGQAKRCTACDIWWLSLRSWLALPLQGRRQAAAVAIASRTRVCCLWIRPLRSANERRATGTHIRQRDAYVGCADRRRTGAGCRRFVAGRSTNAGFAGRDHPRHPEGSGL
jgi:hypothetical protein